MKTTLRLGIPLLLFSFLGLFDPQLLCAAQHESDCLSRTQYTVPVTLSPQDSTVYNIVGWLSSEGPLDGKTVQVLLHGGSYDHNYFDFPYQPGHYSYVERITTAGYVTFNVDRIGSGLSDHPVPELVTLVSNAYTIHQIVQSLRNGAIGGEKFSRVILVGHSLGSGVSLAEAGTYNDVDGVILSGFASAFNPAGLKAVVSASHQANLEARFANLPDGYITTIPGERSVFYSTEDADPNVIVLDETLKQTWTDGEASQYSDVFTTNTYSSHVTAPVLIANGSEDILFSGAGEPFNGKDPNSIRNFEIAFFPSAASLNVFVLNNSGHDVNLHLNAPDWFDAAREWADQYVGP